MLTGFVILCLALQYLGSALALWALSRAPGADDGSPVTVLRPICGLENNLEETLESTFSAPGRYEVIFCAADAADPAIAVAEAVIARHPEVPARVLVGDDKVSGNPKLNNLVKGWKAATHDLVLMSDSNVLLPPDYLARLRGAMGPGVGLVSSPPIGIRPEGFAAHLECAFLNTHQARWQMAGGALDQGFAQGKMLFWRKEVLERAGGIEVLGAEMAEDVASTKVVRAAGLKVRLVGRFFEQPVGRRSFATVWSRQLRWAKVRRMGFRGLYLPEVLAGAALPFLALLASGEVWALPGFLLAWYLPEAVLAYRGGWPRQVEDIAAWVLRDALNPVLWVLGWRGNSFEWRGNAMDVSQVEVMTEAEILALIQAHGLWLLAPLAVAEGPIVTIGAGWLAKLGVFAWPSVYLVCVLGDLVGDAIWYWVGRSGPKLMPPRWWKRLGMTRARRNGLTGHYADRGGPTLLFGKLTHTTGLPIMLAAGMARMPFGAYLLWNLLGTLPKTGLLLAVGWFLGQAMGSMETWIWRATLVLGLVALGLGFWFRRRRCV